MNIRVFAPLLVGMVVLMSIGCTRREHQSNHNPEVGRQLTGCWELVQSLETQIATDEANPQLVTGTVESATTTVLCFGENQEFSLETVQEFLSYTPAEGVEPVPQTVVQQHFTQAVKVTGSYIATPQIIEYDQAEISANGAVPVPFEEFVATGAQVGERVQRVAWSLRDDKLTLSMVQGHEVVEVVYTRVR